MKATLSLSDGFTGKIETLAGGKVKYTIEAPDTEANRALCMNSLFCLQDSRGGLPDDKTRRIPFGYVTTENLHNSILIREEVFGGTPLFETLDKSRFSLDIAQRTCDCLNRFNGIIDVNSIPHVEDMQAACKMLFSAIEGVLLGRDDLEALESNYWEASEFFNRENRRDYYWAFLPPDYKENKAPAGAVEPSVTRRNRRIDSMIETAAALLEEARNIAAPVRYRGTWKRDGEYKPGDITERNGDLYKLLERGDVPVSVGHRPEANPTRWQLFAKAEA